MAIRSDFDNPWGTEYTGSLGGLAAKLGIRPARRSVASVKSSPPPVATSKTIASIERETAEIHRKLMAESKPAWPFAPASKPKVEISPTEALLKHAPIETPMLDKLSKAFKALGIDADKEIYSPEEDPMVKPRTRAFEAKEEAKRASIPTTGSSEWRTTSVQWLEEKHPEYLLGSSRGSSASIRLTFALASMAYLAAERQVEIDEGTPAAKFTSKDPAQARRDAVENWGADEHKAMRDFIEEGGYAARLAELKGELTMDGVPGVVEVAENEQPFPVARKSTPPKAKVIAQSMDDVVDLATDPEAGGW